jgi:hypothetical protein
MTDAEYRLLFDPQPFCVFLADVAPDTPVKRLRLKLMLFLQGSPFYSLEKAVERLEAMQGKGREGLDFELAIVLGRVSLMIHDRAHDQFLDKLSLVPY